MTILDAGLIPPQPASDPIGFLDAPPYEQEVVAVLKKNCRKISALTSKNEFIQKQYESLGIVIAKLFIANST